MNSKLKYFLLPLIIFIFAITSLIVTRMMTDGFKIIKIKNTSNINFHVSTNEKDKKKAIKILSQNFYYLGKGKQAFVFQSHDKKYVLKFLALNKYKKPFRRKIFKNISIFKNRLEKQNTNRKVNLNSAISSYKIAYELLKKETKVIYLHFNKKDIFNIEIKIRDKVNNSYILNANDFLFIIQKKANNLSREIKKLYLKNHHDQIEKIFFDYNLMAKKMAEKKILNKDSTIRNAGYVKNSIIDMDIGRFKVLKTENKEEIFDQYVYFFRKDIKEKYPKLLNIFDEIHEKIKIAL